MFLKPFEINNKLSVSEIVKMDYRTAEVFRRFGIGYCCGGKWPLDVTCELQGMDIKLLQAELENAIRTIPVSNQLEFSTWSVDFLIDYIINIHHQYLRRSLDGITALLADFVKEHVNKFPWLTELETNINLLIRQLLLSMKQEEEVIFPYIRQIAHAHKGQEPYAVLLVKTLRKPVEKSMFKDNQAVKDIIITIRNITNKYITPENVCTNHRVVMAKLKEMDIDVTHHMYLEQSILFPRAMAIEKEVLSI